MLTSNADDIAKQLQEHAKKVRLKLENMVQGFASEVAGAASANTPVGNAGDLEWGLNNSNGSASTYADLYLRRSESPYFIEAEVGFHSGAWRYSENQNLVFDPNIYPEEQVTADTLKEARANYRLGNTFYIGAVGPGYGELQKGSSMQAPDGITKPTIQQIQVTYSADLKRYYDQIK